MSSPVLQRAGTGPSLPALRAAYDRCVGYADHVREDVAMDEHVSDFWSEILGSRRNFPTFDEMLVMRRGFTYPVADRAKVEDLEEEEAYARSAWAVVGHTVPREYFRRWSEPAVGAPIAHRFDGVVVSAGGIVNALTSYRIVELCRERGLAGRPLRILEIGAGYGQVAAQLLQQLDVTEYAVCDLPENLFLAGFYLQAVAPERTVAFVGEEGTPDRPAGLTFAAPPFLDALEGPWDLIINSYSFQEMTRPSVDGYLAHAERTLAPDGVVYSLNAHGKGGTGIQRPSDYAVERFDVAGLAPVRRFPWQVFATVPYELVLAARSGPRVEGEGLAALRRALNGLGEAVQLGLHDEIVELCHSFVAGERRPAHEGLAAALARRAAPEARAAAARELPPPLGPYLEGSLAFARGDGEGSRRLLSSALETLAPTHAALRAHLVLGALAGEDATGPHARAAAALAPHLGDEIARRVSEPDTTRALVASRLGIAPGPGPTRPRSRWRTAGRSLRPSRRPRDPDAAPPPPTPETTHDRPYPP